MKFLKIISFLVFLLGIFVVGRYVQAKYLQKQANVNLKDSFLSAKNDIFQLAGRLDAQLGKVLGEKDTKEGISGYVRQELPREIQEKIKNSQVVKEIQMEVADIINSTTENIQELPQKEIKKLKKDISSEICRQVLEEQDLEEKK